MDFNEYKECDEKENTHEIISFCWDDALEEYNNCINDIFIDLITPNFDKLKEDLSFIFYFLAEHIHMRSTMESISIDDLLISIGKVLDNPELFILVSKESISILLMLITYDKLTQIEDFIISYIDFFPEMYEILLQTNNFESIISFLSLIVELLDFDFGIEEKPIIPILFETWDIKFIYEINEVLLNLATILIEKQKDFPINDYMEKIIYCIKSLLQISESHESVIEFCVATAQYKIYIPFFYEDLFINFIQHKILCQNIKVWDYLSWIVINFPEQITQYPIGAVSNIILLLDKHYMEINVGCTIAFLTCLIINTKYDYKTEEFNLVFTIYKQNFNTLNLEERFQFLLHFLRMIYLNTELIYDREDFNHLFEEWKCLIECNTEYEQYLQEIELKLKTSGELDNYES